MKTFTFWKKPGLGVRRSGIAAATAVALALSLGLPACSNDSGTGNGVVSADNKKLTFSETTLLDDPTGVAVSEQFFDSSSDVVVASASLQDQWEAAQQAVELGAPMLVLIDDSEETQQKIDDEIDRLGADNVHRFEDHSAQAGTPEDAAAIASDAESLNPGAKAINSEVEARITQEEDEALASVEAPIHDSTASIDSTPNGQLVLRVSQLTPEKGSVDENAPILVNGTTSVAEVATARAKGAELTILQSSDPRESAEVMADPEQNIMALGAGFSDESDFQDRLALAKNGEINGGGGTIFPGRRMVALYGHPSGGALGVLGEQPVDEAVQRVQELAAEYQEFTGEPVLPAFEIIATVADAAPGPNDQYTSYTDPSELKPWIDAITEAGGYAVIDLQPGRANFLEQAKYYEDLLKNPNVGLALDPEWRIGPDEVPLQRVGSVDVSEINETADWLAKLVRDNNLPQKALVLHQFQLAMIENREDLDTSHPELEVVLHADGHGTPDLKFQTWGVLQQNLPPNVYMAWKNFYDEDNPTFTPEETYAIHPRPWFVSYQ